MPISIISIEEDPPHKWAVASSSCNLSDASDALISHTVDLVRNSYGEERIIEIAKRLLAEKLEEGDFELSHLRAAFRMGLPDPGAESNDQPKQFRTSRSESAEMVAKAALRKAYNFTYPAAPQEGKVNENQKILGFDGWGLLKVSNGNFALVLLQVKATDQDRCPPNEANKLASECKDGVRRLSRLARALTVLSLLIVEQEMQRAVLEMLALLGGGRMPIIIFAPAIIRGLTRGDVKDLTPVRDAKSEFAPAVSWGITISIGAPLDEFGKVVMQRARATG